MAGPMQLKSFSLHIIGQVTPSWGPWPTAHLLLEESVLQWTREWATAPLLLEEGVLQGTLGGRRILSRRGRSRRRSKLRSQKPGPFLRRGLLQRWRMVFPDADGVASWEPVAAADDYSEVELEESEDENFQAGDSLNGTSGYGDYPYATGDPYQGGAEDEAHEDGEEEEEWSF